MKFKEIKIGEWFDFIGENRALVSFWKRVQKKSTRVYEDADGLTYRVGSINVDVYHVDASA